MNSSSMHAQALRLAWALLSAIPLSATADLAGGPDPYAAGFGFDRPEEAAWGGWKRGDAGTLYAEWDIISDRSYGAASDRTAAPDTGRFGTATAWLGWNAGTFVAGTLNLYSFTVPEQFSVNLAGSLPDRPLRVVLQVETQGNPLDARTFTLNGAAPTRSAETFNNPTFPNETMGPVELSHRQIIWELTRPPESLVLSFASKDPHLSLTQVAVDVGPALIDQTEGKTPGDGAGPPVSGDGTNPVAGSEGSQDGGKTDPAADNAGGTLVEPALELAADAKPDIDRVVLMKLPAETLTGPFTAALQSEAAALAAAVAKDTTLTFVRKSNRAGTRTSRKLAGTLDALFDGPMADLVVSNALQLVIYRPLGSQSVLLAECSLKAQVLRSSRWTVVSSSDGVRRVRLARYRLELQATDTGGGTALRTRLKRIAGICDVDPETDGVQSAIPALQNGDYAVVRRR